MNVHSYCIAIDTVYEILKPNYIEELVEYEIVFHFVSESSTSSHVVSRPQVMYHHIIHFTYWNSSHNSSCAYFHVAKKITTFSNSL